MTNQTHYTAASDDAKPATVQFGRVPFGTIDAGGLRKMRGGDAAVYLGIAAHVGPDLTATVGQRRIADLTGFYAGRVSESIRRLIDAGLIEVSKPGGTRAATIRLCAPAGPSACAPVEPSANPPASAPAGPSATDAQRSGFAGAALGFSSRSARAAPERNRITEKQKPVPVAGVGVYGSVDEKTLTDDAALLDLFGKLTEAGVVNASVADRLFVIAAAERALAEGRKPAALFVKLVRDGNRSFPTEAHEDRAAERIKRHLHGPDEREPWTPPTRAERVSHEDPVTRRMLQAQANGQRTAGQAAAPLTDSLAAESAQRAAREQAERERAERKAERQRITTERGELTAWRDALPRDERLRLRAEALAASNGHTPRAWRELADDDAEPFGLAAAMKSVAEAEAEQEQEAKP